MMVKIRLLVFFLFGCGLLAAQNVDQVQSIDVSAIEYLYAVDNQSQLYYGKEQENYHYLHLNHPAIRTLNHSYLIDYNYTKARLSYHKVIYPEAMLRLDFYNDELVVFSPDLRNIVLTPDNVDFAEMHGQTIIYFRSDSLPGCPSNGYYILLHSENCKVLKRQTARLATSAENTRIEYFFVFSIKYYLFKDGVYHTVKNKRGLLNVLHPYKSEMRRFISSNRLKFKRNADELISLTVKEYEKISNAQ